MRCEIDVGCSRDLASETRSVDDLLVVLVIIRGLVGPQRSCLLNSATSSQDELGHVLAGIDLELVLEGADVGVLADALDESGSSGGRTCSVARRSP